MNTKIYDKLCLVLDKMKKNPDSITTFERNLLEKLYSKLCKTLGISEHAQWRVEWRIEKWMDAARKISGFEPDEILIDTQNIILDTGANEMLKLITGTGGTAFSSDNAYIYVGTDYTAENAAQLGVLATGSEQAYSAIETGYPVVNGRQMVYRATFGEDEANFDWREISITNGTGVNAISMNRKVPEEGMGVKKSGIWTVQLTISLTSST